MMSKDQIKIYLKSLKEKKEEGKFKDIEMWIDGHINAIETILEWN